MSKLHNLFCTLVLYNYNVHMLHWKVKDIDFGTKHALFDEYYETLNGYVDEVAEMLMMNNETNLPTLVDVVEYTNHGDEIYTLISGNNYYSSKEAVIKVKEMFDHLIRLYEDITKDDSYLPSDMISKLEEHEYWLRKESSYKLMSTLKN